MVLLAQQVCCRLLGIDHKTLRRWAALAQIAFLKRPLDARLRCLAPEHLQYLATIHDRPLDPSLLPEQPPSPQKNNSVRTVPDPPQESTASLKEVQQFVETLQHQLTQLALELLQERSKREEWARLPKMGFLNSLSTG